MRLHGQPKQQHPPKEGRCLTLDGVIHSNTATGTATTGGRARTTSTTREDHDPRDTLMHDLDLPRGEERELVIDRERVCGLNGDDSRTLAAVGTFRVVPEQELEIYAGTIRAVGAPSTSAASKFSGASGKGHGWLFGQLATQINALERLV